MKNFTRIIFLYAFSVCSASLYGQSYCTPTVDLSGGDGHGITNFQLNTINRNSPATEGYMAPGATQTTTLVKGNNYNWSMTIAGGNFCSTSQLSIYIDFNDNGTLDDAGEQVYFTDPVSDNGTYTGSFTVPAGATEAVTRMRVMEKMSNQNCLHDVIEPCGSDVAIGFYHGEVEDYDITISATAGIEESGAAKHSLSAVTSPNGGAALSFFLENRGDVALDIYNMLGQKVASLANGSLAAGKHLYAVSAFDFGGREGIYIAALTVDGQSTAVRFSLF